jgi:hypothetical protein
MHLPLLTFLEVLARFQPASITFSHNMWTATSVISNFTSRSCYPVIGYSCPAQPPSPASILKTCIAFALPQKVHFAMPRRSLRDVVCSSYNTASQKRMHAAGNALKERCRLFALCLGLCANFPDCQVRTHCGHLKADRVHHGAGEKIIPSEI